MATTTDQTDPGLKQVRPNGQNENYLVLSDEERAKGFVRPVRQSYKHVGCRPTHPTRPLTAKEEIRHAGTGYICFEAYPPDGSSVVGRYWTQKQLDSGCGTVTTMGPALAETYAAKPDFYGATFCCGCGKHFPVGVHGEFVWVPDGSRVGT